VILKNIIQIAGIHNQHEIELLVSCGVDYIGFPFRLTHHQEDISETDAAGLIRLLPNQIKGVLITYLDNKKEIINLCRILGINTVQLHGEIRLESLQRLKESYPDIDIFKSIIIGKNSWEEIEEMIELFSPAVTAFITDTFDPSSGASGATGKIHDWNISRRIVQMSPKPVILAGGLNPDNIEAAIDAVQPAGVDVHSGVEDAQGFKESHRVRQFVTRARKAFDKIL
jgi:phosphoribosylanthranilate isomerase